MSARICSRVPGAAAKLSVTGSEGVIVADRDLGAGPRGSILQRSPVGFPGTTQLSGRVPDTSLGAEAGFSFEVEVLVRSGTKATKSATASDATWLNGWMRSAIRAIPRLLPLLRWISMVRTGNFLATNSIRSSLSLLTPPFPHRLPHQPRQVVHGLRAPLGLQAFEVRAPIHGGLDPFAEGILQGATGSIPEESAGKAAVPEGKVSAVAGAPWTKLIDSGRSFLDALEAALKAGGKASTGAASPFTVETDTRSGERFFKMPLPTATQFTELLALFGALAKAAESR